MKITEKQLVILLEVLRASLRIVNFMPLDQKSRKEIYNEIVNQQSDELKDIDGN